MEDIAIHGRSDPVIAVCDTDAAARAAVKALCLGGFDMAKLSIVGKGSHIDENAPAAALDHDSNWGTTGGFWGAVWGVEAPPAMFMIPGVGLLATVGPFAGELMAALEGMAQRGPGSVLVDTLRRLGASEEQALLIEQDIKAERLLLIVCGDAGAVRRAREVLAPGLSSALHEPELVPARI